jgi:ABC-type multidrug transport system ATPase subunit
VREYVEQAARLAPSARSRKAAAAEAERVLTEFELGGLAQLELGQLLPHQIRALSIAVATLDKPPVLCLETPLRGLDAPGADYVARLCAHAAEQRRVVVSSALPSTPSPERALLDTCDELFWLERGALTAHGTPEAVFAPKSRYLLTLAGAKSPQLRAALTEAGCQLTERASPTALRAFVSPESSVTRYLVELPETSNVDLLLDTALATGVTVLELEPLLES